MYQETHSHQLVVNPLLIVTVVIHVFLELVIMQEINAKMFLFVIMIPQQLTTIVFLIEIVLMIIFAPPPSVLTISVLLLPILIFLHQPVVKLLLTAQLPLAELLFAQ